MYRKVKDGIIGLAIGDALGVPVEFESREALRHNPVTGYRSGGTHGQPEGTWSDDTSMTICLLECLEPMDHYGIMNNFHNWIENGDYTATGTVFDYGRTTQMAISKFNFDKNESPVTFGLKGESDCGNGSLMRILPLAFFLHAHRGEFNEEKYCRCIEDISSFTHAHPICKVACAIYVNISINIIDGYAKEEAVSFGILKTRDHYSLLPEFEHAMKVFQPMFAMAEDSSLWNRNGNDIRSDGYVVSALDAALWCFLTTSSYEECVLKAVNLGEDTDTTAAVAGGLAGMYYGLDSIPEKWVSGLKRSRYLQELSDNVEKILETAHADVSELEMKIVYPDLW